MSFSGKYTNVPGVVTTRTRTSRYIKGELKEHEVWVIEAYDLPRNVVFHILFDSRYELDFGTVSADPGTNNLSIVVGPSLSFEVGARALPEHLVSLDLEIKLDRDAFYVPKFRVHQRLPRGDRQLEDSEETGGKRKRKLKN